MFLLIILCAYSFINLEVTHHVKSLDDTSINYYFGPPDAADFINWTLFGLLFIMTLWSLYQIVNSSPGYIGLNQQYNMENMVDRDRLLY